LPNTGKCGDGICDKKEFENPNLCPADCKEVSKIRPQAPVKPKPAQPPILEETTRPQEVSILPDNFLYMFKRIGESIVTLFTFGKENKAKRHLYLAQKRIAEVQELAKNKANPKYIEKTLKRYQKRMDKTLFYREKIRKPLPQLEERLSQNLLKHQEVLLKVYEQVPEQSKDSIQKAIEKQKELKKEAEEKKKEDKGKEEKEEKGKDSEDTGGKEESKEEEHEEEPKDADGDEQFISGFKLKNLENIDEKSEAVFALANELGLDYILVPVGWNWQSSGLLDQYHIAELSKEYGISILPAFYHFAGQTELDKDPERYADFVVSYLDEFKEDMNIKYIEFQNEPNSHHDGEKGPHFSGTPADLAESNTVAYEKVKERYPDIIVGTAGFIATTVDSEENKRMNSFVKSYLASKPKFDSFNIHQYPKTSSYLQKTENPGTTYNFMSENEIFNTYRDLLDDYGYSDKKIFATEGAVQMPFKRSSGPNDWQWLGDDETAILLMERFVLTLSEKKDKNLIGSMISGIEADSETALFDYNENTNTYTKTNKFYFYKKLLEFIDKYPVYSKHVSGEVGSENYWVEEFKDNDGNKMWMAFCPFLFEAESESSEKPSAIAVEKIITCPQEATINVDNATQVKISKVIDKEVNTETKTVSDGKVSITLEDVPVFVE
jgi:hypothetical protein